MNYFKSILLSMILVSMTIIASPLDTKELPPGSSEGVKPNVMFIIDNSGSMSWSSRMLKTKTALKLLFEDNRSLIEGVRPGLGVFPAYYCTTDHQMILNTFQDPLNPDGTDSGHIDNILTAIMGPKVGGVYVPNNGSSGIGTPNWTPIGNALHFAGRYMAGAGATDGVCNSSAGDCALTVDRCRKNYIILFTDGAETRTCATYVNGQTVAGIHYNDYLSGNDDGYKKIETYAIGFDGQNVNAIASAGSGGTRTTSYSADSPETLVSAFRKILTEINANETTNSAPTIVPSFDNGDDEVLYQAVYKPRAKKQWTGTLTKYKLDDDGWIDDDVMWQAEIPSADTRNVYTRCKMLTAVTDFTLANYEALLPCLGAGLDDQIASSAIVTPDLGVSDETITLNIDPEVLSNTTEYPNDFPELLDFFPMSALLTTTEKNRLKNFRLIMDDYLSGQDLSYGVIFKFKDINIENRYDYIYIKSQVGTEYTEYLITGTPASAYECNGITYGEVPSTTLFGNCTKIATPSGSDLSVLIPGDPVEIKFSSDGSVVDSWFTIESITIKGRPAGGLNYTYTTRKNETITKNVSTIEIDELKKLIVFLRGKDSFKEDHEDETYNTNNCITSGTCPDRTYKLSDIYNSRSKYVGQPFQYFPYASYQSFKLANKNRKEMIFVGSNGGMLHAFPADATSGKISSEQWSFIPPNLLTFMKKIRSSEAHSSISKHFVDASPKIMDIWSGTAWKTVLLMGFGAGGAGMFALDITVPDAAPIFLWAVYNETPLRTDGNRRVLYWGSDGTISAYDEEDLPTSSTGYHPYDYSRLGDTFSEPVFAQIGSLNPDGSLKEDVSGKPSGAYFYVVFGGGRILDATGKNQGESIFVINPLSGVIFNRFDLPSTGDDNFPGRVSSTVSILPNYKNAESREIYSIYTGDTSGRIWRMRPQGSGTTVVCGNGNTACQPVFKANSSSLSKRAIFQTVALSYDQDPSVDDTNLWVYAGTGDIRSGEIDDDDQSDNYVYAFKDSGWKMGDGNTINEPSSLVVPTSYVDQPGYKYEIGADEKLVATPTIIDGYVYYTAYKISSDTGDICTVGLGQSYLYSFKLYDGEKNPDFKESESSTDTEYKMKLGSGISTAPVVKGQDIYFGISGKSTEAPQMHNSQRKDTLIKWRRTESIADKKTVVPFAYFREIF